ncbi:sugar kinase [Pseudomonas sp. RIT-PI-S]|uniref:sugar kinase n=1 Tax=Pseudomonas sp. RIT-PI-S TaxID=3035295 RepID=UPI0021D81944|nr:sugar kinase [Pseudomonas sp. RIT-PI-S]
MPDYDVLGFGETMAMFVADEYGDLAKVDRFHKRIAGADSNVAIGLARLGLKVAWLSRVGEDAFGRFVVDTLAAEGLDCRFVRTDPQRPTGFQLKSSEADGRDPTVEYFRRGSAASALSVGDLDPALFTARHLHATGIVPALSGDARALSRYVMAHMRERGHSVSFDPNLRPSLWPNQAAMIEAVNELACQAHWVLPGLAEGRLLTGQEQPRDIAAWYLDQGVEAVAIKLGPEGAYYRTAEAEGVVPGFTVARVVDTVGAGDGFAVGVISALLEGQGFAQAVRRGNWIGSLAVQSPGDMEGLPRLAQLHAARQTLAG